MMNINKKSTLKTTLALTVYFSFMASSMAAVHTVPCTDSIGDRLAIQNAINDADKRDIIHITGTCMLDGERIVINKSNLTIRGDAVDTDNDGKVDQWNTVIRGKTEVGGEPVQDDLYNGPYTNLGFHIGNVPANNKAIKNVTIKNLEMRDMFQALVVSPGVLTPNDAMCNNIQRTNGQAKNIHITNNLFENNVYATMVVGKNKNIVINKNHIKNNYGTLPPVLGNIMTYGKKILCDSETNSLDIGVTKNLLVLDNHFEGNGISPVFTGIRNSLAINHTKNVIVSHNTFIDDFDALAINGGKNTLIKRNYLRDILDDGMFITGSTNTLVIKNKIDGAEQGIRGNALDPNSVSAQRVGLDIPGSNNRIYCNRVENTDGFAGINIFFTDGTFKIGFNQLMNNALDVQFFFANDNKAIVSTNNTLDEVSSMNTIITLNHMFNCAPN